MPNGSLTETAHASLMQVSASSTDGMGASPRPVTPVDAGLAKLDQRQGLVRRDGHDSDSGSHQSHAGLGSRDQSAEPDPHR